MRKAVFTILFLTLLALGAMVSVPSLDAASNCTYYSDATYTTVVGQYGYDCCNNYVSWGKTSSFYVCGGCFICFPPPR